MKYTKEKLMNEVNVTDKYVAFWGSVFSNFYPCKISHHGHDCKSSEQLFMYYKAMFFGDDETVKKIEFMLGDDIITNSGGTLLLI